MLFVFHCKYLNKSDIILNCFFMRKKVLLFGLFFLLVGTTAVAQRQQISTDYVHSVFDDIPFNMSGKMTYSYVANEIGQSVKDGPLSINCDINTKLDTYLNFRHVLINIVGKATVNATYSNGDLNGAINSNYKATLTEKGKNEVITASMRGNFTNGMPNGNFVVNRKTNLKTSLNANYKNGILVGAFSCSLIDDDSHAATYSGTLSQNGKFIGQWNLNGKKATFQNGVLISESYDNYTTRAAVVELSKKYAAGTISKEELAEKNIFIKTSTVNLGNYARTAILRDSGIDFEKIGGYDFTISNNLTYEYLDELAGLTDAGIQLLAQQMDKKLRGVFIEYSYLSDQEGAEVPIFNDSYAEKYGVLCYDEKYSLYYIFMHVNAQAKYINPQYVTGTYRSSNPHVYISPKQMELLDEVADKYYVENSNTLINIIYQYAKYNKYDYATINYLKGSRDKELKDLIKIQSDINEMYQTFLKESTPHKNNEDVILWKDSYILKSSIAGFETLVKELNETVKEAQEAIVKKTFDFLVKNGSASAIVYDGEFEELFTYGDKKTELWRLEASKILKPFCKIVGYEIIEIIDTKLASNKIIKCKLFKKGKKDTKIIHEMEVELNDGKLKLESFDINKAKLIEN